MFKVFKAAFGEINRFPGSESLTEATATIQRALGGQVLGLNLLNGGKLNCAAGDRRGNWMENLPGKSPVIHPEVTPRACPAATYVPGDDKTLGGQFLWSSFTGDAGSRPYKIYVPSAYRVGLSFPLIVMLHGCTQSPDDFAAGTRMNHHAEQENFLVVYPAQTAAANMQKCWNWFNENDQRRDKGEPSLIAGITREVIADYSVDPRRVYVAGLSAGGAAAAIMASTYPDIFAAVGVHSGLACGAASNMKTAFGAMLQGNRGDETISSGRSIPAIVFHGDQDATVNQRNGQYVSDQLAGNTAISSVAETGRIPGGHAYQRVVRFDAAGKSVSEQWVIHGAGHAWAGGCLSGSYTDPRGPNASREMVRFFMEHFRQDQAYH